ncbi:MAG: hypothetical protein ABR946_03635 [Solirubrobacteraceae bacterium]
MRRAAGLIGATLLSAILLAACGGGSTAGLIPSTDAVVLGNDLSALESALSEHSCDATQTALNDVFTDISTLPSSVNTRLRDNLLGGYEELDNTARTQCHSTTHTHTHTGSTGTSTGPSGTSTGPGGTSTGPGGTSTGPSGTSTGPGGTSTGNSGTVGPGGGSQAPTGSSGITSADAGGVASAP